MRQAVEPARRPELNRALSNAVGHCYHRCTGRGPAKAQTFYQRDVVVVVLHGTLTVAERTLISDGRKDAVQRLRAAMHEAMTAELADAVQALTGCQVLAAMSSDDVARDIAAELFLLEAPRSDQRDVSPESVARNMRRPIST